MRSLRPYAFKTDAHKRTVFSMNYLICKGLIGFFARGPQEKFYRVFTAVMNIVAYAHARISMTNVVFGCLL